MASTKATREATREELSPGQKAYVARCYAFMATANEGGVFSCAPTFCVKKSNGEWRIVHDFRGLNPKIRVPGNPIPSKENILRTIARGRLFSAMDLLWGFFRVKLQEKSIPFTAFATPDGLFEYLATRIDVSSSSSSFNRLVQSIFADLQDYCQTYFDDLFVFTPSDSVEEHLAALKKC